MPSIGELLGGAIGDKRNNNERRYEKKDNRQIIGKGGSGKLLVKAQGCDLIEIRFTVLA